MTMERTEVNALQAQEQEQTQEQEQKQEQKQEEKAAQERPAAPALLPEEDPQTVAALQQELQTLKEEKNRQLLLEEVRALLEERQVPTAFAGFLLGPDPENTRQNAAEFCRQYEQALRQAVASRLPRSQPRDFDAARPRPSRRGIFRM